MRKRIANIMVLAVLAAGTCGWALAQDKEEPPDRAIVPLSNPAKPAKIEVSVMRGSITIKGYQGKEVIVEARAREKALTALSELTALGHAHAIAPPAPPAPPDRPALSAKAGDEVKRAQEEYVRQLADQEALAKRIEEKLKEVQEGVMAQHLGDDQKAREEKEKKTAGLKRLSGSSSGLEVEEEDNVVQISTQSWKAATDLVIQVPVMSSLEVRSSMDGAIVVEGVNGEIDINNINGPVTLRNVSGNTLVHTVNGDIEVVLTRIAADKPLSFSTMSGDIDVTLPADIKANLKMKSDQGEIYTDFDMTVGRKATRTEVAEKTDEGNFHITFDKSLLGQVNGGGQEISFNAFQGDIYIRKKK